MSVVIKAMSDQDLPDTNLEKGFKLFIVPSGASVEFTFDAGQHFMLIKRDIESDVDIVEIKGNVYVMENGKTVATYWPK